MDDSENQTIKLLTEIRDDQREALGISRQAVEMSRQLASSYKALTPVLIIFFVVATSLLLLVGGVFVYDLFHPVERNPHRDLSVTHSASVDP
mgnify:CR=1 FL=1